MRPSLIAFDNSKDLGDWYDKKYTEMGGGWKVGEEEALRLIDWAGFKRDPETLLLDIGSGDGDFLSHIDNYFTCTGIDLSAIGIDYSIQRGLKAHFYIADVETFNHTPEFDYLTSIGSIEHVINLAKALKNCYSLLKHGGNFLCLVPNELWLYDDQPQEQTHTDEEWAKLFEKAGFKVLKVNRRSDLTDFLLIK